MKRINPLPTSSSAPSKMRVIPDNPSFVWSFRPILIVLNVIGVDLNWGEQQTTVRRYLINFSRLFWLMNNIWSIVTVTQYQLSNYSAIGKDAYALHIDVISYQIQGSGIYVALILATWLHGKQLVEVFTQLETQFRFKSNMHGKIRRVATIAVVLSTIAIISRSIFYAVYILEDNGLKLVTNAVNLFTQIYFPVSIVMFCTFGWSLAKYFEEIKKQVDSISAHQEPNNALMLVSIHHSLVCQAVWQLEKYFSRILLLPISCIFVNAVYYSYYAIDAAHCNDYGYFAIRLLVTFVMFVLLVAICYIAELITNKATDIHRSLIKSRLLHSESYRQQVINLMSQVRELIPELNISGYVILSPQLIPALIGTTVTYVIVLYDK